MKKILLLLSIIWIYNACIICNDITNPNSGQNPISDILNEDGTLNMNAPSGSYSAIGYNLASNEGDEEPVFLKSEGTDVGWTDPYTYNGLSSTVYAVVKIGSRIYVGGYFTNAGGNENADYIAYWDGYKWNSLGSTPLNSYVYALATDGSNLYVGGSFTSAGGVTGASRIAKWNGSSWSAMATGASSTVYAILVDGTNVYIGGYFTSVSGISNTNKVAKWDGSNWTALGVPTFSSSDYVYSLDIGGGFLYVGGDFDVYGGNLAGLWLSSNGWYNFGVGNTNGVVYSVKYAGSGYLVYAGGTFVDANSNTNADYIAKVNYGGSTTALGTGLTNYVREMKIINGNLYVAGAFNDAGGDSYADKMAIWDGTNWSAFCQGSISSTVYSFDYDATYNNYYVGGAFTNIDGEYDYRIAMYSGNEGKWNNMSSTFASTVYAVLVDNDGDIFVAGNFINAAGIDYADRIVYYDVSAGQWVACETGLNSTVFALATYGSVIYAGGSFINAGGDLNADYVAAYDKSTNTWSALTTTPLNNTVRALDFHSSLYSVVMGNPPVINYTRRLYIGGDFSDAGGVSNADYLCLWQYGGTSFNRVGSSSTPSLTNSVYALDAYGGGLQNSVHNVIVGGAFTDAYGDGNADYLTVITTSGSYGAVSTTPLNSYVLAIKYVDASNVYIGGAFTNLGNSYGDRIAKWNGTSWESMGTGLSSYVYSINVVGNNVFAGGYFSNAGGDADADRIAYYDGKAWIPLGTGVNSYVYSLAVSNNFVYTGGSFSQAGSKQYEYFARYGEIPEITTYSPTSDQTLCEGQSINMSISAATPGSGLSYAWYKNGSVVSYSSSYTISSILPSHAGTYECKVSNSYGHTYSKAFTLTVNAKPAISTQPVSSQSVCESNGTATYTVVATGYSLQYKWQSSPNGTTWTDIVNGGIYGGATTASLTITNPATTYNNYRYHCKITNSCDTTGKTTNTSYLYVNSNPAVSGHPSNSTICPGNNTTFSVTATGYNLSYQWQYYNNSSWVNLSNTTPYSGVTTSTLTLTSPSSAYSGIYYRCLVTGGCGSPVNSNYARLTINENVTIDSAYNNVYACENTTAQFKVVASGTGLSYKWYNYVNGSSIQLSDAAPYSGTLTNNLTIDVADALNGNYYYCKVTGTCNTINVPNKQLYVYQAPEITLNPVNDTACVNTTAGFSVTATGYGTLYYQWQSSTDGGNNYSDISGATSSVYSFSATSGMNNNYYRCVVSGTCSPSATSSAGKLVVKPATLITDHPDNVTICEGEPAGASIVASDATAYQWQRSTNNGSSWNNLPGLTNSSIYISEVSSASNGYQYRCVAYGECTNVTSNVCILTVNSAPVISAEPQNNTVCLGGNASFFVTADHADKYQWQYYNVGEDLWMNYINDTLSTFVRTGVTSGQNGLQIRCIARSSFGCEPQDTSAIAQILIYPNINITTHPSNKIVGVGGVGTMSVVASGNDLSYQWQISDDNTSWSDIQDIEPFTGIDSTTLVINEAPDTMDKYFRVVITDECSSQQMSNSAYLEVKSIPAFTIQPVNVSACAGSGVSFNVTVSNGVGYFWEIDSIDGKGFREIAGTNSATYNISSANIDMDGFIYRCASYNSGNIDTAYSNAATLTIKEEVQISIHPEPQTKCEGSNATFHVASTGTNLTYQWKRIDNPTPVNVGINSPELLLTSVNVSQNDSTYYCVVTGDCGTATSSSALLTVNTTPIISIQPKDTSVCENVNCFFAIEAIALSYQWQVLDGGNWTNLNGGNIYSGSTTDTLKINQALIELSSAQYRCLVVNNCGTTVSEIVTLTVNDLPNITAQPSQAEICAGSDTLFGIEATGYNITYQWKVSTDEGGSWSDITGENDDTLHLLSASSDKNGNLYRCQVNGTCMPYVTSNTVQLVVNSYTNIIEQPVSRIVCENKQTSFKVEAEGSILGYQWYEYSGENWNALLNEEYYLGVTTDSLIITGADTSLRGNQYYCEIVGICSDVNSNQATITINEKPEIITEPLSLAVCDGIDTVLTVEATGEGVMYTWQRAITENNWVTITNNSNFNVSDDSLKIFNITNDFDNNMFRCIVSGDCEPNDTSLEVDISVFLLPEITYIDEDTALCEGESITLTASATSSSGVTYTWLKNETEIDFDNSLILNSLTISDNGIYKLNATNMCGTVSDSINITVHNNPVVNLGEDINTCINSTVTLFSNVVGTCHWSNGSDADSIEVTSSGTYSLTVTDINNCIDKDTISVAFIPPYNNQQLAFVTVDENNHNIIVWNRSIDDGVANYNIYKELGTNEYDKIATVDANSGLNQFIDESVNSKIDYYSYTITISDTCGNESNYAEVHTNMNLYITKSGNSNILNWNGYDGITFNKYIIFRGIAQNSLDSIYYRASDREDYIDAAPPAGNVYYQLQIKLTDTVYVDSMGIIKYKYKRVKSNIASFSEPIAEFTANQTEIFIGDSIQFDDLSTNVPTAWEWFFEGGTANSRFIQHPLVKYNIAGTYYVRLKASNLYGDSIITKYDYIKVVGLENKSTLICEGEDITLNVNEAGYDYSWSTGEITQSITIQPDQSAWYYVTISNGEKSIIDSVRIEVSPALNLGEDIFICKGDTALIIPGDYKSYNWNSGSSSDSVFKAFNAGDVDVVVEDYYGCIFKDTVNITLRPRPNINLGNDTVVCYGNTVNIDAGITGLTYQWNTDETTQSITVDTTGLYIITATNVYNCTDIDSIIVTTKVPYNGQTISIVTVNESSHPVIVWNRTPNEAISTYNIYRKKTSTVFEKIAAIPAETGLNQYIDTSVYAGLTHYSYVITITDTCGNESKQSTVHTTMNLYITKSGNSNVLNWNSYEGTVFDGYCVYRGSTLNSMDSIAFFADNINTYVDDNPLTGDVFYQIQIRLPEAIEVDSSGSIKYQYSNINSNITSFLKPEAEFTADLTEILVGNSVHFTDLSTNAPTAWQWIFEGGEANSEELQNPIVTYNLAGTFDVTLSSSNIYGSSTLIQTDLIKVVGIENKDTIICEGDEITLSVNDPDYNYIWSTGHESQNITIKPIETSWYYVTISDGVISVVDSVFVELSPAVDLGEDISICDGNTATISLSGYISYNWNSGESTANTFIASGEGLVDIVVEDNYGCIFKDTLMVTLLPLPQFDLGNDTVVCYGNTVNIDAGITGLTYQWNTDETTQSITVDTTGLYILTVTNANNCSSVDSIIVTTILPYEGQTIALVTIDEIGHPVIVWERTSGEAISAYNIYRKITSSLYERIAIIPAESGLNQYTDTNVFGGVTNYSYEISITDTCGNESKYSSAHTTMNLYITKSGNSNILNWNTYKGMAFDGYCIFSGTAINSMDSIGFVTDDVNTFADNNPLSGDVFYQLQIRLPEIIEVDSIGVIKYEYNTIKSNLTSFLKPEADFSVAQTQILVGKSVQFTDLSTNDPTAWQWVFEGGEANSEYIQNPVVDYNSAGIYDVTLSSTNKYGSTTLTKADLIKVIGIEYKDTIICEGDEIILSVNDPGYTYLWSTGGTSYNITISPNETSWYYVTITDGEVSTVDSAFVEVSEALQLGEDIFICQGETFEINPGDFITYNWNSGESYDNIFEVNSTGIISLLVEDENGCIFKDSLDVTVYELPLFKLANDTTVCYGNVVTIDAGIDNMTYQWNTGESTQSIIVDTTGIYKLTVTDIHSCSSVDSVSILVKVPYADQEIFLVTVDEEDGKNMIIWEKPIDAGIDSFRIYKESYITDVYKLIGTKEYNEYNYFIDIDSRPRVKADKYKISVVDTCGNESALSEYHKTIHLTSNVGVNGSDTVMNLIWNDYVGFSFGTYYIYRGSTADNLTLIYQIAYDPQSDLNSWTDEDPIREGSSYYQVAVDRGYSIERTGFGKTSAGPYSRSSSNMEDNRLRSPNEVNEAPTDITLSVDSIIEKLPVGTAIGAFTSEDSNSGDVFSYLLVPGIGAEDNGYFYIDGDTLRSDFVFDYITKNSFSIRVRSTDYNELYIEKVFVIRVISADTVTINLTNNSIAENLSAGTVIGSLSTVDPDNQGDRIYTLVEGVGSENNSSFAITDISLQSGGIFDYESKNTYSVRIRSALSSNSDIFIEKQFTLIIVNENEAPTNIVISNSKIFENLDAGIVVGKFSSIEPDFDDSHTYSLTTGTGSDDNAKFEITNDSLLTEESFDYEVKNKYSIRVKTSDHGGKSFEKQFVISVLDEYEVNIKIVSNQSNDFIIVPNPFIYDAIIRSASGNLVIESIDIYNASGVLLRQEKNINKDTYMLSREFLKAGLYYVKVYSGTNIYHLKMIIQ